MVSVQDRLYALMDYFGRPKGEFANAIGTTLNNLSVYYHRDRISKQLLKRIRNIFPEVNPEWLEFGEGDMFLENASIRFRDSSLLVNPNIERLNMFVPGIQAEFFIRVTGFTMEPLISNGDAIGIRSQELEYVDPSKPYLLVMGDGTLMIKMISEVDTDNISILSGNTEKKSFTLPRSNVKGLYKIIYVGKII